MTMFYKPWQAPVISSVLLHWYWEQSSPLSILWFSLCSPGGCDKSGHPVVIFPTVQQSSLSEVTDSELVSLLHYFQSIIPTQQKLNGFSYIINLQKSSQNIITKLTTALHTIQVGVYATVSCVQGGDGRLRPVMSRVNYCWMWIWVGHSGLGFDKPLLGIKLCLLGYPRMILINNFW